MERRDGIEGSKDIQSATELLTAFEEMRMLNKELLAEREQEILLQFPWTGSLGHWYWNLITDSITNHQSCLQSLGYQSGELSECLPLKFFEERIHSDDYETVKSAFLAHLQGDAGVFEAKYRMRNKNNEYMWFYGRGRVTQYDDKGTPIFMAGIVFDVTDQMRQEQAQRDRDEHDPLTQLYTCEKLLSLMNHELVRHSLEEESGIIVFDINRFCIVNAVVGQFRGDTILRQMAEILRGFQSDSGIIARLGGDEFVLFLPGVSGEECGKIATNLQSQIEKIHVDEGQLYRISISIGMSVSKEKDGQILLDNAMVALCHAKKVKFGEIIQYEKLQSYVDFLRTYPISKIDYKNSRREDIVTFAYRVMEHVSGIKNALQVLFSRISSQYAIQSICVTAVGERGWTEQRLYLWTENGEFSSKSTKVRLSEQEYQRRAKWLAGDAATVMTSGSFGGVDCETMCKGGERKYFPRLYCPVYVQGVYQGNVIFAPKKLAYAWERKTIHQMRIISNVLYNAICREKSMKGDQAKSEFLSRMGHEARTPLNTIVSMLEIVKNNAQDRSRVAYCLNKMEESAQYLLSLVYDVMDMSRNEITHLGIPAKHFSLKKSVGLAERLIYGVTEGKPNFQCVKSVIHNNLMGDGESLSQVLLNLLANAVKFTSKCGQIGLDVKELGSCRDGYFLFEFVVWDTGIGIPEKGVERLQEAFEADSYENYSGLGDGLLACIRLLKSMDSHLKVESVEGRGSRFSFQLILMEENKASPEDTEDALLGKTLLVVDDNEMNLETVRDLLESQGAKVDATHNGKEALEAFRASTPGYYDLLLTDLSMPFFSGIEVAKHIRGLQRCDANLPIIAASTESLSDVLSGEEGKLFTRTLIKPVDIYRLIRAINGCFDHGNQ